MVAFAGHPTGHASARLAESGALTSILSGDGPRQLEQLHLQLVGRALEHIVPTLAAAYDRSAALYRAGGAHPSSDGVAASAYAAAVLVELAANGELETVDVHVAAQALADARGEPLEAAMLALYLRTVAATELLELPPPVAAGIICRLLMQLGVVSELSVWQSGTEGAIECVLYLGEELPSRGARSAANATIRGRSRRLTVAGSSIATAVVRRFGSPCGAVVGHPAAGRTHIDGYLVAAAAALAPVFERAHLQLRGASRERALVAAGEKRLTTVGFDLHDGPIQEALAVGNEIVALRDQLDPFILDSHRDLARGRFDDLLARAGELDRQLREMAHSLESRSIVSRPVGEVLHRAVDTFRERTGVNAKLDIKGDPETVGSAQRVALFRVVQESLSNIREHAGASEVTISLHARRHVIQLMIQDDGHGFDVPRALARAAQNGRLGLVGIGERVRMLGGTFDLDSRPGGPTRLTLTLPRAEQLGT